VATALNHPNVMREEVATIPSSILIANEERRGDTETR